MNRFAISLSLLLLFPVQTPARSLQQSDTPASECGGLARACSAAARELKAARDLISGYERHIAAADERIKIAQAEIENLKQLDELHTARAVELEKVIAAERDKIAVLLKVKAEQEKRIANLEKQLGRARKFALITGVAAAVGILIATVK